MVSSIAGKKFNVHDWLFIKMSTELKNFLPKRQYLFLSEIPTYCNKVQHPAHTYNIGLKVTDLFLVFYFFHKLSMFIYRDITRLLLCHVSNTYIIVLQFKVTLVHYSSSSSS